MNEPLIPKIWQKLFLETVCPRLSLEIAMRDAEKRDQVADKQPPVPRIKADCICFNGWVPPLLGRLSGGTRAPYQERDIINAAVRCPHCLKPEKKEEL